MESPYQLADHEKSRIRMEELYRRELTKELDAKSPGAAPKSKVWAFMNTSFGLWFLSTIVVGLITFGYTNYQKEQQQRLEERRLKEKTASDKRLNEIEDARRNATLITGLLPHLASEKKMEWRGAMAVMGYLYRSGELPNELQSALIQMAQTDTGKGPDARLSVSEQKTNAAVAILDTKVDSAVKRSIISADLPARVYIQIAGEGQRDAAKSLQTMLRAADFIAPGVENVGSARSPARAEVRYYYEEDRAEAARIISLMRNADVGAINGEPQRVKGGGARRRHYEIWFPKS